MRNGDGGEVREGGGRLSPRWPMVGVIPCRFLERTDYSSFIRYVLVYPPNPSIEGGVRLKTAVGGHPPYLNSYNICRGSPAKL